MRWNLGEHWYSPKRIAVAVFIAVAIYAAALGLGFGLYAAGAIPTGATHNDCPDRRQIADDRGVDVDELPDGELRRITIECLEGHQLEEDEVLRVDFIIWGAWPGIICALVFLFWPMWSRILLNQEAQEELEEGGGGHRQQGHT